MAEADTQTYSDVPRTQRHTAAIDVELSTEAMRAIFNKYDKDKNGTIEMPEFKRIVEDLLRKHLSETILRGYLQQQFRMIDRDFSGGIDFREFSTFYRSMMPLLAAAPYLGLLNTREPEKPATPTPDKSRLEPLSLPPSLPAPTTPLCSPSAAAAVQLQNVAQAPVIGAALKFGTTEFAKTNCKAPPKSSPVRSSNARRSPAASARRSTDSRHHKRGETIRTVKVRIEGTQRQGEVSVSRGELVEEVVATIVQMLLEPSLGERVDKVLVWDTLTDERKLLRRSDMVQAFTNVFPPTAGVIVAKTEAAPPDEELNMIRSTR
eukprot:m51a1_g4967 putative fgfr1 oncogene partner-like (320) ;mRNA; f:388337-389722